MEDQTLKAAAEAPAEETAAGCPCRHNSSQPAFSSHSLIHPALFQDHNSIGGQFQLVILQLFLLISNV